MTHFSVTVVTNERPTDTNGLLARVMQPFHRFEATNNNDKHVQSIDQTEELREQYEVATTLVFKRPDGTKMCAFDENGQYLRELREFFDESGMHVPQGWEEIYDERAKDWQSFGSWMSSYTGLKMAPSNGFLDYGGTHHFGWVMKLDNGDYRCIKRTNPDHKWDWWQVGGRWGDYLINNSGEKCDMCRVGDLDLEAMRAVRSKHMRKALLRGPHQSRMTFAQALYVWRDYTEDKYYNKTLADNLRAWRSRVEEIGCGVPEQAAEDLIAYWAKFLPEKEMWPLKYARNQPPLSTWAYLIDGEWKQRGNLGWWGAHNPESIAVDVWDEEITDTVSGLDPSDWITIVDCHS